MNLNDSNDLKEENNKLRSRMTNLKKNFALLEYSDNSKNQHNRCINFEILEIPFSLLQ